jgi:hypothetical protein
MTATQLRRRPLTAIVPLTLLAAVVALLLWGLRAPDAEASAVAGHQHSQMVTPRTAAQQAFHDSMRKLWEDHVTWTRLAIVEFADGSAGFPETANRLLRNQDDIGDAIKPFYGDVAGEQLSTLLRDHITIAVDVLQAAKAGDQTALQDASARWYANANAIADFLAGANPRFWPQSVMRADMRTHLDQTLTEAVDELNGDYAAGVNEYDAVHAHILAMADMLSAGIIGQFPQRLG